jgi:hypothetical protein
VPAGTQEPTQPTATIVLLCAAAWAVPGAGHVLQGRASKGIVFFVALTLMFACGLWLEGQLFPFDLTQPLVALEAFADVGIGIPYFVARALGVDGGRVVAVTYEYGNVFTIVAGLLNMLVVLDAYDLSRGRK